MFQAAFVLSKCAFDASVDFLYFPDGVCVTLAQQFSAKFGVVIEGTGPARAESAGSRTAELLLGEVMAVDRALAAVSSCEGLWAELGLLVMVGMTAR